MIATKKYNTGSLWIKPSIESLPVPASTLSATFFKYANTSFFRDITSNSFKQVFAFADHILLQTPNGIAIDKIDANLSPVSESINLIPFNVNYYVQWWWMPNVNKIFYATLNNSLTLSWYCYDATKNITQTLLVSSLTAYVSGVPNGIDVCFNETTKNFNVSFSTYTSATVGLAAVIFPLQSDAKWHLDPNKIYQFSTPI